MYAMKCLYLVSFKFICVYVFLSSSACLSVCLFVNDFISIIYALTPRFNSLCQINMSHR